MTGGARGAQELAVGDVVVLAVLGIVLLTYASFLFVRRASRATRQRVVMRAAIGLGSILLVAGGAVLAGTGGTAALFSSIGAVPGNAIASATEFTPSAVSVLAPAPGRVAITWAAPAGGSWVRGYNIYRRGDGVAGLATGVMQANVAACGMGTTALCLVNGPTPIDPAYIQPFYDPDTALSQTGIYYYLIRAVRDGDVSGTLVEVPVNSVEVPVLPDPSTPGLLVTWPPANATGIPTNTTLALQFDRPMRTATVEPAYVVRPCNDGRTCSNLGTPVPLAFDWTAQSTLLLVTPQALLSPGLWYRVTIGNGATDMGGNIVTAASWVFQVATGAFAIDATVPAVVGWDPPTAARDVKADQAVTLLFTKPMNMTATNAAVSICQIGGTCLGNLTYRWDPSMTLLEVGHPATAFLAGQSYRMMVTTAARDAAGNQLPVPRWTWPDCPVGVSDCAFASTFVLPSTSADADALAAPYLASASPDAGAQAVAANTTLTLAFSKAVTKATLATAVSICPPSGGCAPDLSFGWDTDGRTVTVYFKEPLLPQTTYQVIVTTRVTDLIGLPLARAVTWSFTTGATIDLVEPHLLSVVPTGGQLGVALAAPIALNFDEPVQLLTVRNGLSVCEADAPTRCLGKVTVTGENGNRTVVVTHPLEAFQKSMAYRIRLSTAVRDLAGNVLIAGGGGCPAGDGLCAWASTFTTVGTADTTAPVVVAYAPLDGTAGKVPAPPATAPLVYTFSEPMDRATVERAVRLTCAPTDCVVPILTPLWSVANTQVTFAHTIGFTPGATYTAAVTGEARDVAGNSLSGVCAPRIVGDTGACTIDALTHSYTVAMSATAGGALAVLPPVGPAPGSTDIGPNTSLTVLFSRAVAPTTAQGAVRVACAPAGCIVPTAFRYAWNVAGTLLTATPATAWTPGSTYTITVGKTVIDTVGGAITPDATSCVGDATCAYRWQFTVPSATAVALPPLAPVVTVPVTAQWTALGTAAIAGCVPGTVPAPGAVTCTGPIGAVTVELWRDTNADGLIASGVDLLVATQSLTGGLANFSFVAPLEPTTVNSFAVRVIDAKGLMSTSARVPAISQADTITTPGLLSVLPGPGTLTIAMPFTGDMEKPVGFAPANQKATAVVEWGDTAVAPIGSYATCQSGNSGRCPLVRSDTGFGYVVNGLTLSTPYAVRVTVTDPDGVSGNPVRTGSASVTGGATGGLFTSAGMAPATIATRMGQSSVVTVQLTAAGLAVQARVSGPTGLTVVGPCVVPAAGTTVATWSWNGRDAQDAYVPDGSYTAQVTAYGATGCSGAFQSQVVAIAVANAAGMVLSPDPYTVTVAPGESAVITARVATSLGGPVGPGAGALVTWKAVGSVGGDVTAWLSRTSAEVGQSYGDCSVIDGVGQACVRLSVPVGGNAAQTIAVTASVASQSTAGVARTVSGTTSVNDPPEAPAALSLSAGSINFAWRASKDTRVVGYKIYVGTLPGVYETILDAGKATAYHWEDTMVNQVYYAVVRSYDALGLLSAPTNEARIIAKTGRLAGTPPAAQATATAYCAAQATLVAGASLPQTTALAIATATPGGGVTAVVSTLVAPIPTVGTAETASPGPATAVAGATTPITCANRVVPVVPTATATLAVVRTRTPVPSVTVGVGTPSPTPVAEEAPVIDATGTPTPEPSPTMAPSATPLPGPPAQVALVPPPLASSLGPGDSLVVRAFVTDDRGVRAPDVGRTVVRWRATLPGGVEVPDWLGSVETFVGAQSPGRYGACSVPANSGQTCTILMIPKSAVIASTLTIVAEATGAGSTASVRTAVGSTQIGIVPPRGVIVPTAVGTGTVAPLPVITATATIGQTRTMVPAGVTGTPGTVTVGPSSTGTTGQLNVGTVTSGTATMTPVSVNVRINPSATRTVVTATPSFTPTALVVMTATPVTPSPTPRPTGSPTPETTATVTR